MYEQRIKTVRRNLANRGLEQMLVCDPRSIHYLTGAFIEPGERFLGLIVGSDARPTLVLNALFAAPADAACTVRSFTDTDDPLAIVEGLCDADKPLGCDKNLPARFLLPLMERGAASGFVLASDAVDDARAIKDDTERELMRAASAANDAAMDRFRRLVHEGVTEADVAGQLEAIYRELGAQGHSFTPIVSFGANAADPHHEPDDTPLASGDVVLFDVGCRKGEYCSDMTRTFVFGEPSEKLREVHDTVRRANEAARKLVAPGVRFCDIDAAAQSSKRRATAPTSRIAWDTRSASTCTSPATCRPRTTRRCKRAWCSPSSRASTCPASSACASRTSCWSPKTAAKCSTATPASWFRSASAKKSPGWFLQRECGRFA